MRIIGPFKKNLLRLGPCTASTCMQEPCPNVIPYVNLRTAPSLSRQLVIDDEKDISSTRSLYVTPSPMHTINAHGSRNTNALLQLSTISYRDRSKG